MYILNQRNYVYVEGKKMEGIIIDNESFYQMCVIT